ncbi:MAG: ATP-binding cassette domain-containing protein [Clostridia bacterium]
MINLVNIRKKYKNVSKSVIALKNVSFSLPDNGLAFIIGKSGSGKSTLLNILGALDKIDSGDIIVDNKSISKFSEKELDSYRNQYIGFVFQDFNLLNDYNVEENIKISLDLQKKKCTSEDIKEILKKVDLENYGNRKINELSGGEKQRVAIARALIKNPKMILCDEPTGALDSETSRQIFELLKKFSSICLVIVVSHDKESAEKYGDRLIELKDGNIISDNGESSLNSNNIEKLIIKKTGFSIKKIFNLAYSFLKHKPFRIIIALFLAVISISFFAFSNAISADNKVDVIVHSMMKNNKPYLSFSKQTYYKNNSDDENPTFYKYLIDIADKDIKNIKEGLGINKGNIVYKIDEIKIQNFNNLIYREENYLYNDNVFGFTEIDSETAKTYNKFSLYGKIPQKDDEVVIPKYFYDMFEYLGYKNSAGTEEERITEYDDLIGKSIFIGENKYSKLQNFKIVGILDTNFNIKDYLYCIADATKYSSVLDTLGGAFHNSMHNILYLNNGFFKRNYNNNYNDELTCKSDKDEFLINPSPLVEMTKIHKIKNVKEAKNKIWFAEEAKPDSKGLYFPLSTFFIDWKFDVSIADYIEEYAQNNFKSIIDEAKKDHPDWVWYDDYAKWIIENNYCDNEYTHRDFEFFRTNTINRRLSRFVNDYMNKDCIIRYSDHFTPFEVRTTIGGIYDDIIGTDFRCEEDIPGDTLYLPNELYTNVIKNYEPLFFDYSYFVAPLTDNFETNKAMYNFKDKKVVDEVAIQRYNSTYKHSNFDCENEYTSAYVRVNETLSFYKTIFFGLSIGFLVVDLFFMYYYISGVIYGKKKEIGILRSLGTSKSNVVGIFTAQNSIISIFVIVISSIISLLTILGANLVISSNENLLSSFISFSYIELFYIVGLTILSVLISTLIPIIKMMKKKPIDIIKDK